MGLDGEYRREREREREERKRETEWMTMRRRGLLCMVYEYLRVRPKGVGKTR